MEQDIITAVTWSAWIYGAVLSISVAVFIVSQQESFNCSYEGYIQKRDFKGQLFNYFNFRYTPLSDPGYYGHMKKDFKLLGSRNMWNKWMLAGLFIVNPIIATIWLGTYLKTKKDYYIFIEDKQRSDKDYEINTWMDSELLKRRGTR